MTGIEAMAAMMIVVALAGAYTTSLDTEQDFRYCFICVEMDSTTESGTEVEVEVEAEDGIE